MKTTGIVLIVIGVLSQIGTFIAASQDSSRMNFSGVVVIVIGAFLMSRAAKKKEAEEKKKKWEDGSTNEINNL